MRKIIPMNLDRKEGDLVDEFQSSLLSSSRGTELLKVKAQDIAEKIEGVEFNITNETLTNIFHLSDMNHLRFNLGETISLYGRAFLCMIPVMGNSEIMMLKQLEVTDYQTIGSKVISAVGNIRNSTYDYGGEQYLINYKFYINSANKFALERYIVVETKNENGQIEVEQVSTHEPFVYKQVLDLLEMPLEPIQMFKNNIDLLPDGNYFGVMQDVYRLNAIDAKMVADYSRSRSDRVYASQYDGNKLTDSKSRDSLSKDYSESYTPLDVSVPTQLTTTPMNSVEIFWNTVNTLTDRIMKQLKMFRETDDSGTNKHDLEILKKDSNVIDNVKQVQATRQREWDSFFTKICSLLSIELEQPKLQLPHSIQTIIDMFDAKLAGERAKAQGTQQPAGTGE